MVDALSVKHDTVTPSWHIQAGGQSLTVDIFWVWPCKENHDIFLIFGCRCCVSTIISQQSLWCRSCWYLIRFLCLSWLCAKFVCISDICTHCKVFGKDGWSDLLSVTFCFLTCEGTCVRLSKCTLYSYGPCYSSLNCTRFRVSVASDLDKSLLCC